MHSLDRQYRAVAALSVAVLACLLASSATAAESAKVPQEPAILQVGTFPEERIDTDGDGVMDIDDNCPNTPGLSRGRAHALGVSIDQCGCPLNTPSNRCDIDSDDDGVPNCEDLCPQTLKGLVTDRTGCAMATPAPQQIELNVKFATARANLQARYVPDVDALANLLRQKPRLIVVLEGHTDSRGTDRYNAALANARAQVIRRELLVRGASPRQVYAVGYGETFPAATNSTRVGRAQNRRTVATLFYQ